MNRSASEVVLLVPPSSSYPLYRRRFYVLFVFTFLSFNQCLFWLTFSPISPSTQIFYQISESTVNLLLNWGPIIFIPCLPLTYLLLNKSDGLRRSVVLLAAMDFCATLLRVVPLFCTSPTSSFSLCCIHLGQILNAGCGPLVMAPVSQLSCLWFGPNERTRATTLAIMAGNLGLTIGFLISPWIVHRPEYLPNLLYVHLGLSSLAALFVVIYFPGEPPTAPSPAAQLLIDQSVQDHSGNSFGSYMRNVWQCWTTPSFRLLCLIGGLTSGAFAAWTSLFANSLASENFNERQAGWFGCASSLAAMIGGLSAGVLADTTYFRRSFKSIILSTLVCCFLSLLWFQLSVRTVFSDRPFLQPSVTSIALSITLTGLFQGASLPLIYEALAETMFPLPESLSASVLVQLNNVTALLLIFIPPDLYKLMNLLVISVIGACIVMASLVKIDYKRRNEDERKQ